MIELPIFNTAPQGFLKLLSRHIKSNFCAPGEYLVHGGDALNYIYLVCNGSMEVLQNCMVVAILGKGDLVGCDIPESLNPESLIKSSSNVKALTYCDLKSLHIPGLLEVLKLYPEFAEIFCTEIIHDLTFNLREGYDGEPMDFPLRPSHSLTLPSISEDDEDDDVDNEREDRDQDEDDSGSGSPSPPPMGILSRKRRSINDSFGGRDNVPLIMPAPRRPALRFCSTNSSSSTKSRSSGSKAEVTGPKSSLKQPQPSNSELHDQVELTRSSVERLDTQMSSLTRDVSKLSEQVNASLGLLLELCSKSKVAIEQQTSSGGGNCDKRVRGAINKTHSLDENRLMPSQSIAANGSKRHQPPVMGKPHKTSSSGTQTERFLLEDLLCKMTEGSGSPPPNSGYSSSSSNEEKVRYLMGISHSGHRVADDECVSDDSGLKNSLTIQSITSSRDVSPYKGNSRNSWSLGFGGTSESLASPAISPRPVVSMTSGHTDTHLTHHLASGKQSHHCAIDMDSKSKQPTDL